MISDRLTPSQTMLGARVLDRPHSLAQESEGTDKILGLSLSTSG